ncbi:putative lipid II flippase MurJ [Bryobacterales bacterium F-183]|nr:putative lipid II flippase MurJ [Bryobacterales bacterium F-183]
MPSSLPSTEPVPETGSSNGPAVDPGLGSQTKSVARSAGIVSVAVMASRVTGLLRESFMASKFGASMEYDAFMLGFRIPNLTRDLFAEGALSSAFVPTFTEYLQNKPKEEAVRLVNLVATALILVVGALCLAGVIFAPQLVNLIASGFHNEPGKFELAVRMTRIMFPFLLVVALAAQVMGVLNACNIFGVPALASTFFNIGSVTFGFVLGFVVGPTLGISRIEGMAWGVVLGGTLQLIWQMPSLFKMGFRFWPEIDWSHPGMRRILALMGPAILGNAAVQINVMINTDFASQLTDPVRGSNGAVSWLGYAFRFMQLPIGIFGVAIASATVPAISRTIAREDFDDFRRTMSKSLAMVFLLTIPSSVGLAVLGEAIIGSIYQRGAFNYYDTQRTATALSFYAIGLAGYSALKVVTPAYYALKDSRTPMLISLLSVVTNYLFASRITKWAGLGHSGLALSTSAVAIVGFLVLYGTLYRRVGGLYGRNLMRTVVQVSAASAAMGAVVWFLGEEMQARFGTTQLAHVSTIAVSIPVGIAVFYYACRMLKVSELDLAFGSVLGPIRRRLKI